jgi:hypothetical protein
MTFLMYAGSFCPGSGVLCQHCHYPPDPTEMERLGKRVEDFAGSDIHKEAENRYDLWYEAEQRFSCSFIVFFAPMNCIEIT